MLRPTTRSIVACDRKTGEFGVAVQSELFAAGAVVPLARAGVGAVAVQAWFDPSHGANALQLLETSASAEAVLAAVLAGSRGASLWQVGILDREGRVAAHTGPDCVAWAGHIVGEGFCCQGVGQPGPHVVAAMAEAFQATAGPLPERLVAALEAGERAEAGAGGGQSAALRVARANSGFAWLGDRYVDIRVDDHGEPVAELGRLLRTHRESVWGRLMEPVVVLDAELIGFIQQSLRQQGRLTGENPGQWDKATEQAFHQFCMALGLEVPPPLHGVALPQVYCRELFRELVGFDRLT